MGIILNGLSYKNILDDISFSLSEGDIVALIGANGAGKTTLLKNIMGLAVPSSGTVNLENSRIAAVFQENILDEELSVQQNFKFRIKDKSKYIFSMKKLEEFGISPKALYSELSGGQKRIVNYLRAISVNPNLLILDELTAGIDVDIRQDIWRDLNDYLEKNKSGVIFTTHQLDEMDNANKVLFLEDGKVKYFGSMFNFIKRMPKVKLLSKNLKDAQYFDSSEKAVEFVQKSGFQKDNFEIMKTTYTDLFQNMEARD
ncbi:MULTISPECIES: ATP-binding cassette domain-containing protein [Periweissella]|uniref:ABC transporter ATP-binding protein n=2 Tax=Periweissella TaxID=2930384 RepID=A0A7X6N4N1_9LACO|nr:MULTISPECIES: ABC transporter ATP-binding protein [Periweissella]MBM7545094.1 ABC-type multidrug transport system ATPase subunit [Periweissella beninensis]MCM0598343.1 ABC transporter ATP-binding protein [Periweissella fabalis]MCM2436396.1 ABC transporter ATP-binding protein [Periweissella beninensis]MCT4396915.1 ABC transporter ATP-binding protein [Periweissella beninensis]NKZ24975.1 ABC transporter ATP-binding protein [Periweissella fabalis]